jgi:hypothetical protein
MNIDQRVQNSIYCVDPDARGFASRARVRLTMPTAYNDLLVHRVYTNQSQNLYL